MKLQTSRVRLALQMALSIGVMAFTLQGESQVEAPPTLDRLGQTTRRLVDPRETEDRKFSLIPVPISDPTLKTGG